ncbi:MAG: hypothetical protein Q8K70_01770 [Bacteroidota bacterium]|nr:hypothetical protein [Bacteroidota bacterium]
MKIFILSFITIFYNISNLTSQNYRQSIESFHTKSNQTFQFNNIDSTALKYGICNYKITICNYDKKGNMTFSLDQIFYDKDGRFQQQIKYSDSNKLKISQQQMVISNSNHQSIMEYYQNGKSGYKTILTYNDSNKTSQRSVYNLKNRLNHLTNYTYNEMGLLSKQANYNHKLQVRYHYEYYYFQNKKLKQSVLKSGKKTKTWDYTCEESGEIQKKAKDTIKICTTKSYQADGSIIAVTTGFTWNGKPYKTITLTDSFQQLLSIKYHEGDEDELMYSRVTTYQNKKIVSSEYHTYQKGKLKYHTLVKQDLMGRITSFTSTSLFKKERVTTQLYEYNENGFITNKKTLLNNRLIKNQTYTYQYF